MKIPDLFKAVQRQIFQDKTIQHRPAVKQTGSLGSVTVVPGSISSSYECNFQLLSDALVAQEWGLVVARDAKATSSDPLPIDVGDYVQHKGKVYKVIGHPVYDSHDELILQFQQGLEAI
jgi:hypothetical protein